MTDEPDNQLISRERLAHIDQMLADIDRALAQRDRTKQEIYYTPWQVIGSLMIGGMTAGAALFAAGAAFIKILS